MITYELAKELRDNGFPIIIYSKYGTNCQKIDSSFLTYDGSDFWKLPTLSELIEACGDYFNSLTRVKVFKTGKVYWQDLRPLSRDEFDSPEEAVAKLWLAINKKQQ
jgi:hypothetical protein